MKNLLRLALGFVVVLLFLGSLRAWYSYLEKRKHVLDYESTNGVVVELVTEKKQTYSPTRKVYVTRENTYPLIEYSANGAAFRAIYRESGTERVANLVSGSVVPVFFDPNDPKDFVVTSLFD